jgi:uncharacterized damage-inducible protein DinB
MNSQGAARQQLQFWHGALNGVMGDCGEALNKQLPGATITSISSVYAHMVFAEDVIVNGMLQGKPPLYQQDGWEAKAGVPFPGIPPSIGEWAKTVKMDFPKFNEYAKAVFANTDSYLASVSDADLQKKVQTPIGEQTAEWAIVTLLATHAPQHIGEIAALKGVQGLKGLPF